MDETGGNLLHRLISGFALRTSQSRLVVVDSHLCRKYQAEPGTQEWVTVVECICIDGNLIPPLVISKGEDS
jgi:hypothetical protein